MSTTNKHPDLDHMVWPCRKCGSSDETLETMIECSNQQCLRWYHFSCVGIDVRCPPKDNEEWICPHCGDKEAGEASGGDGSAPQISSLSLDNISDTPQLIGAAQGAKPKVSRTHSNAEPNRTIAGNNGKQHEFNYFSQIYHPRSHLQNTKYNSAVQEDNPAEFLHSASRNGMNNFTTRNNLSRRSDNRPIQQISVPSLSATELAARKVFKSLPDFDGTPSKWIGFFASYQTANQACRYQDYENMHRLKLALKGKALAAVEELLIFPEGVERAINILKIRFGREEYIINEILDSVRNFPKIKRETQREWIINYSTLVMKVEASLKHTGDLSYLKNPILLADLVEKMPEDIQMSWAVHAAMKINVSISDLSDYLNSYANIASSLLRRPVGADIQVTRRVNLHNDREIKVSCEFCKNDHQLKLCDQFKNKSYDERKTFGLEKGICFICARKGHMVKDCYVKKNSKKPMQFHPLFRKPPQEVQQQKEETTDRNLHCSNENDRVLFKILPISIHNKNIRIDTYAFLDDGSSVTLIDEKVAKALQLNGTKENLCYSFSDESVRTEENSLRVQIGISAKPTSRKYIMKNVRTVKKLDLPEQSINVRNLSSEYKHLKNIDMYELYKAKPTILIGLEHSNLMTPEKIVDGPGLIAHETKLGWVVFGNRSKEAIAVHKVMKICEVCQDKDYEVDKMAKSFFSAESIGVKLLPTVKNKEDSQAEKILAKTTKFDGTRYESGLLWREENVKLPNNYKTAVQRLICTERKVKSQNLCAKYNKEIESLIEKGYAKKLCGDEKIIKSPKTWYLPHFNVYNPNKPKKFRIVFDAAQKTDGVSLNSRLLTGPDLYKSILEILFHFRLFPIALCGDIKEMFQQILIMEEDQHAQRFLWRNCDSSKQPDEYMLKVMTFGATCSPTTAQAIKNINAQKFLEKYPTAANAIIHKHFVDDYLDSFRDKFKAVEVAQKVIWIHKQGGFELRNFVSNSKYVLNQIAPLRKDENLVDMSMTTENNCEKVLGMYWLTEDDVFTFRLSKNKIPTDLANFMKIPTKRELLRIIMSIYDPYGLLGNYIVQAKIMMQEIWIEGTAWDEQISNSIFEKWKIWFQQFLKIEVLKIPRCFCAKISEADEIQLHTFCDASEKAYSTVGYLRIKYSSGIKVAFVASKTKVAPTKHLTIPRLELQAAVIGSRLADTIKWSLKEIKIDKFFFWSDSKTVLSWISPDHRIYKSWVAARVSEILDTTTTNQWHYINSKENVADEATKWDSYPTPDLSSRWYAGPQFLLKCEENWPKQKLEKIKVEEEMRNIYRVNAVKIVKQFDDKNSLINVERFSQYNRLLRTVAWIYKLKDNDAFPSVKHIKKAEIFLYQKAQWECYKESIIKLKNEKKLEKSNDLYTLTPFLDSDGLLRLDGRLKNAPCLDYDTKFPIILPRQHHITKLIVRNYHKKLAHQLQETLVNELRKKFWITKIRLLIKSVKNNCSICQMRSIKPTNPYMSSLPPERVTPRVKPFLFTFVDYFGPIHIKLGRKLYKRWGVLYTCMVTRAITLDLVYDLTSEAAIMSVKNLICRRGRVEEIYSDCATTFKAASKEFNLEIKKLSNEQIRENLATQKIEWKFSPPASPHMNGAVERMVRTVKSIYKSLLDTDHPTESVLRHLFFVTEDIVNNRPLHYSTIEPGSTEILTPNHFLIGLYNDLPSLIENQNFGRRQWRYIERMKEHIWKRFLDEYLPTLNKRAKWQSKIRPVKVGDLVLIVDDQTHREGWRKGLVQEVYLGKDHTVRSAKVKMVTGELIRPVVKLVILNLDEESN